MFVSGLQTETVTSVSYLIVHLSFPMSHIHCIKKDKQSSDALAFRYETSNL